MSDVMNFKEYYLFGKQVIGRLYKNKHCSIAVVYKFNGDLIDAQIFDTDGNEIVPEKIKEDN
jgi:hypothetical protein